MTTAPPLSRAERRLASFCRLLAAVYLAGAAVFALVPTLAFRVASGDPVAQGGTEALFWSILAASSMLALGVASLMVVFDVRVRRHALLSPILAKLLTSVLALAHLGAGRAFLVLFACDAVVCLTTLVLYRAAAPGVHLARAPADRAPEAEPEAAPAKVQLGLPK